MKASHRTIGIVETDMATLADAKLATSDLEAWLLSLPAKRRTTPDDVQRLCHNLHRINAGLEVVTKYLRHLHRHGWETPDEH